MDSKHQVKPTVAKGVTAPQRRVRTDDSRPRPPDTHKPNDGRESTHEPAAQRQVVRKRGRADAFEAAGSGNNRTVKRSRLTSLSSDQNLCQECTAIRWSAIQEWMSYKGRFTWVGMMIADVGKRYRDVSPSTSCPLCHQLWAPWIDSFVRDRHPTKFDFGDRIHIFRHLRHLPQVNDFPTSVQAMRENHAPFHIAVVPILQGWRDELREHFATRGMVVVVPPGQQDSEIFNPRQVSPTFDPQVVRSWKRFCRRHRDLCNPEPPAVTGLKLIDCNSDELTIKDYSPDDSYVALSYVWGESSQSKAQASSSKRTPRRQQMEEVILEDLAPTTCNVQSTQKLSMGSRRKVLGSKQGSSTASKPAYATNSRLRLPENLPLTIRDAIQVTKALGLRFLWIDKYCIDQSNEKQKQEQFSRMGDIYAGAQITIFALGHDATYGLPGVSSRPRCWQQQCTNVEPYQMLSTMPDPHLCIKHSKWSTRAWTYQEGLFSTRRLFFTDHQIYFECNAMNATESFKSNLKTLHTQNGQRLRAYHRAGRFVCGNSNTYSHLKVVQSKANHHKIDIIHRCQFQIRQYTKRELTYKDDALNAFAGIARYYAKTTAKIASLAGIPVPFPLAKLSDMKQEGLDYLSYALAWTHRLSSFSGMGGGSNGMSDATRATHKNSRWDPYNNPKPQRRGGFPSWSWAGWLGEIEKRNDFPHCWTSLLSGVRICFQGGSSEDHTWLLRSRPYKQYFIRRLLTAEALHLDAFVLNPERVKFWEKDPEIPSRRIQSSKIHVSLSKGASSLKELHKKLLDKTFECLILGTHGEPRKDIICAIRNADKKSSKARKCRIDLLERLDADSMICLIVHTVDGKSERIGLLRVEFEESGRERGLEAWASRSRRKFVLV